MSFTSWAKGIFNGTTTANASAPSNVGGMGNFWSGLDNMFTGNLDYLRQWELFSKEMEFNSAQAEATRNFNSSEAQKNRDFQEMMSNTAYQRAFEDMRKAGLNPYLAYSQGGASSPSGSVLGGSTASTGGHHAGKSGSGFEILAGLFKTALSLGVSSAIDVAKMANSRYIAELYNDSRMMYYDYMASRRR